MKNQALVLSSLLLLNVFNLKAYAYLDPGVGSMALQILLTVIAGCLIFFRSSVKKLFAFFKSKKKEDKNY